MSNKDFVVYNSMSYRERIAYEFGVITERLRNFNYLSPTSEIPAELLDFKKELAKTLMAVEEPDETA